MFAILVVKPSLVLIISDTLGYCAKTTNFKTSVPYFLHHTMCSSHYSSGWPHIVITQEDRVATILNVVGSLVWEEREHGKALKGS